MKKFLIIFISQILFGNANCQEYSDGVLRLLINDEKAIPTKELKTSSIMINEILTKYNVKSYKQAMPWSEHELLKRVYLLEFEDQKSEQLIHELKNTKLYDFVGYEKKPIATYDPTDYMWTAHPEWLWHLSNIRAPEAWDITFGGNSTIAIIDSRFDIGHPDLVNKYIVNYDPYSLVNHTTYSYIPDHIDNHGTFVASCAISETDGGGQLASIGFDTEFYAYTWNNGIYKAHHASMVLDVDVISISWFYDCSPDPSGVDSTIISDILNNNTIIVAAAGNGFHGSSCSSGGGPPFSPLYPFSPTYDDRLICVSSIGEDNNHYFEDNGANQTHSYFPEVDICAPGYLVMGAQPSLNNQWPYYGGGKGTSFATPMVAGVVALMRSLDNSLTPAEIGAIIEETAEPILDESSYSGMLGAGRINAYKAVLAARPVSYASPPYFTGFENKFDPSWKLHKSNAFGRIEANTDFSPKTGSRHLTMDVSINNNYCTNEAWLHLNLSGKSNVGLQFYWKETSDETHPQDGVFISDDGGNNFTKIYDLAGGSSTYQKVNIDLSSEISNISLSHSSTFVIKFQQYDNYQMSTDGMAFDDINICTKPSSPAYIYPPYEHCMGYSEEYTCSGVSHAVEYEWATDDPTKMLISQNGSNAAQVTALDDGTFNLKVRAKNTCGQFSDWKNSNIYIDPCVKAFNLYPNPTNEVLTIEKTDSEEKIWENASYSVSIISSKGLVHYNKTFHELPISINTKNLEDGVYSVRIIYNEKQYSYEIIIKH